MVHARPEEATPSNIAPPGAAPAGIYNAASGTVTALTVYGITGFIRLWVASVRWSVLFALLLVIPLPGTNGVEPHPAGQSSAQAILEQALHRAEARHKGGIELRYETVVLSTLETLGPHGEVTGTETKRSRRYPLEGEMYEEIIESDGLPLSPDQVRRESRKREAFVRSARRRATRGLERDPKERRMRFGRRLMSRYRTVVAGRESVRGHECWILAFEPHDGPLPSGGGMNRALNQSTGKLWIRTDDYELARIEFSMREPIRYLLGLFAILRQAAGEIEFDQVDPGIWMPIRFQIELDLSVLAGMKTIRRRIRNEWLDYRRLHPEPILDGRGF